MPLKNFSIRIDDKTLNKLHWIADYEARSINGQIQVLIRDCIQQFEKEHGPIPLK